MTTGRKAAVINKIVVKDQTLMGLGQTVVVDPRVAVGHIRGATGPTITSLALSFRQPPAPAAAPVAAKQSVPKSVLTPTPSA